MEFKYYNSIRETKSLWKDLELPFTSYTLNYELYEELYDFLCSNKIPNYHNYSDPYIVVGFDNNRLVGILPFITRNGERTSIYNCGFIGYLLPVIPSYLHLFAEKISIDLADISHNYLPRNSEFNNYYFWEKSSIIDLRNINTIEEYLLSLSSKKRKEVNKIINLNKEIRVEESIPENYSLLKRKYNAKHWIKKRGFSMDNVFNVHEILFKYSNVCTITCYLDKMVVAINKAIIDNNTLLGYVCIRPTLYDNFIFSYSIFKLIELAINKKIDYFNLSVDLGSKDVKVSYKKKFLNTNIEIPCILSKVNSHFPPYYMIDKWIF